MSGITLELIADIRATHGTPHSASHDVCNHVHKRIDRFIYTPTVGDRNVPVAYMENDKIDSWANLQLVNRTYSLAANAPHLSGLRSEYKVHTGSSYTSVFNHVQITDKTFVDKFGEVRPLFFKHKLPIGATDVSLRVLEQGNRLVVDEGYSVDLSANALFTNYENYFDPDTGAYKLFYVVYHDGTSEVNELLSPTPATKEADWEDIDLSTGALYTNYPIFTVSASGSGFTYHFNYGSTWYIRNQERSLIQPRLPVVKSADDAWYMRFSAGDFSEIINTVPRKYCIPEYHAQSFMPVKPYRFTPSESVLFVNERTLASTRKNLGIDPDSSRHLSIEMYDPDGNIVRALTTNISKAGLRFGTTDVFYEVDKINSWDNSSGIFSLGMKLHPSWTAKAQYFYEADDYTYTSLDLNPLYRPELKARTVVFYIIPDTHPDDRAIHHLLVDEDGIITECSQGPGALYPNLQLFDSPGVVNSSTIIGKAYSRLGSGTFYTDYALHGPSGNDYYVLAECSSLDNSLVEHMTVFDTRRDGDKIDPDKFEQAIRKNPSLLNSEVVYGEQGMESPRNGVAILSAPISLLEEYGGNLSEEVATELMTTRLHSAVAPIIEWTYPESVLTVDNTAINQVVLNFSWEGPGQTYRLYRRESALATWVEITHLTSPSLGATVYTDSAVSTGEIWQWAVRIEVDGILYPFGNAVTAEVG